MAKHISITPGTPPAVPDLSTSRRDILGAALGFSGLAAVAVAGMARPDDTVAAASAGNADANLLALIGKFNSLERQIDTLWRADPDVFGYDVAEQPACKALYQAQKPLFETIYATRATTVEGFRARAEMLTIWCKEMLEEEGGDQACGWPDRMIFALVRDMVKPGA